MNTDEDQIQTDQQFGDGSEEGRCYKNNIVDTWNSMGQKGLYRLWPIPTFVTYGWLKPGWLVYSVHILCLQDSTSEHIEMNRFPTPIFFQPFIPETWKHGISWLFFQEFNHLSEIDLAAWPCHFRLHGHFALEVVRTFLDSDLPGFSVAYTSLKLAWRKHGKTISGTLGIITCLMALGPQIWAHTWGICPTLPNQWHLSIMAFAPRLMGTWQVLPMGSGHPVFRCVGLFRPSQMHCRRFRIFDIPMGSLARICHLGTSLESYLDPGSCVLLKAYVLKLKSLLLNILMDRMVSRKIMKGDLHRADIFWSHDICKDEFKFWLDPTKILSQVYQPSYYQVLAQAIMEFPGQQTGTNPH